MAKVFLGLLAAFLVTILAARTALYASINPDDVLGGEPWAQNKMEFVSWNGERWTAWVRDGAFEHVPQNSARWSRHSNGSLAFVDWEGEAWQAKISGEGFLLAHHGDWQGPTENATAIRYRDWAGKHRVRSLTQLNR
jgi:hypothetical protein